MSIIMKVHYEIEEGQKKTLCPLGHKHKGAVVQVGTLLCSLCVRNVGSSVEEGKTEENYVCCRQHEKKTRGGK